LAINNRRIIPLNWFRQIADSKFANSLKEIAKIAKSNLEQLLYEATIYQEFFELQILVKDESIQWLKNNATKSEILRHHSFNDMLGYKYFLKRVREGLMFSDKTYENGFDARKLPKFSVGGGVGKSVSEIASLGSKEKTSRDVNIRLNFGDGKEASVMSDAQTARNLERYLKSLGV